MQDTEQRRKADECEHGDRSKNNAPGLRVLPKRGAQMLSDCRCQLLQLRYHVPIAFPDESTIPEESRSLQTNIPSLYGVMPSWLGIGATGSGDGAPLLFSISRIAFISLSWAFTIAVARRTTSGRSVWRSAACAIITPP